MEQIISERQQRLDEYRERNPSPHVGIIHYDPDGSLVEKVAEIDIKRLVKDPRFIDRYFMFVHPNFRQKVSKEDKVIPLQTKVCKSILA